MIPEKNIPLIDFLPTDKEPYRVHIGQGIEIVAPHSSCAGVYRGMTIQGMLVLQPNVSYEVTSNSKRAWRWETERPAFISGGNSSMYPQNVEEIIEACNKNSKATQSVELEYQI